MRLCRLERNPNVRHDACLGQRAVVSPPAVLPHNELTMRHTLRHTFMLSIGLLAAACGDSEPRAADTTEPADTAVIADAEVADTTATDTAPADTDSPTDSQPGDSSPDASDTGADSDGPGDTADTAADIAADTAQEATGDTTEVGYLAGCGSFFAVRVLELQVERDPSFPSDCDAPLVDPIARLKNGGAPMCVAGESANACRERLYETPPAIDALASACWDASAPAGCLRGTFLPRCADGSDDCVEPEAVCQDGMRPMVYREAATAGPSDVWLFHLGGEGGPCVGPSCWFNYRFAPSVGDRAFAFAMTSLHPDGPDSGAQRGAGIASGDPSLPYSKINRVRFERCTDGASDAIEQVTVADGIPSEFSADFPTLPIATRNATVPVWHKGYATWLAAFHHMTTVAGRDRDGDGTPELPSLANARLVILSASSDASTWLLFSADRFAAELRAIAGPDLAVRIMIDGNFPPSLDNEARYNSNVPADFDMLSQPYSETGLCELPDNGDGLANEACSAAIYAPGGFLHDTYVARGVGLDVSCEAMHGVGAPECYDRNHTLVHHVATPFLVLADQEDNTISKGAPTYADDKTYFWDLPGTYRRRVVDQAWDLIDHWTTAAREEGAGASGDMILILPKTRREGEPWGKATHVRFGDDAEMAHPMTLCTAAGVKVSTVSYTQMLAGWIAGTLPTTFAIEDARRPLANGNVWVTGGACRPPE